MDWKQENFAQSKRRFCGRQKRLDELNGEVVN
jgi:hypothetical protein